MGRLSDDKIKSQVQCALALDARINDHDVTVTVRDGRVRLTGMVLSLRARQAASDILLTMPAVERIDNELRVECPCPDLPADSAIEKTARDMLRADSGLDHRRIHVEVTEGVAILTGKADSFYERSLAEDIISWIAGVRSVENRVEVRSPAARTDQSVAQSIRESLCRNPSVNAGRIIVEVEGGTVHLGGVVDGMPALRQVYDTAWITPGVIGIDDSQVAIRAA